MPVSIRIETANPSLYAVLRATAPEGVVFLSPPPIERRFLDFNVENLTLIHLALRDELDAALLGFIAGWLAHRLKQAVVKFHVQLRIDGDETPIDEGVIHRALQKGIRGQKHEHSQRHDQ